MELHAQIACAMPRELARRSIGWQTRAVYTEAILYCRENLTDGVVSRGDLLFWMADMPAKQRTTHLDALQTVGALLPHESGWLFPPHVWGKWNPSRAEVEAKRAVEAQRKADYRDRKRNASTQASSSVPDVSQRDGASRGESVPDSQSHSQSQSHSKSHSQSKSHANGSSVNSDSVGATTDDDGIIDAIVKRCAAIRTERARPGNPTSYQATVIADMNRNERAAIAELLATKPAYRARVEQAAAWYEVARTPRSA